MKKTTRIRLFLLSLTTVCCVAYGGGYYLTKESNEINKRITATEESGKYEVYPESAESASILAAYEFILGTEDNYIIVYCADGETVYTDTDIRVDELPVELQLEVQNGKKIYSESELYNFLESYSS